MLPSKREDFISIILIMMAVLIPFGAYMYSATSQKDISNTFLKVELQHNHGVNTANIVSIKGIVECQLQEKGQSYFENKNYVYTYGSTGFVAVNLKTGVISVVLHKDLDKEKQDQLKAYFMKERYNVIPYTPRVVFLDESQLDENMYTIMKILETEQMQYPKEILREISLKRN